MHTNLHSVTIVQQHDNTHNQSNKNFLTLFGIPQKKPLKIDDVVFSQAGCPSWYPTHSEHYTVLNNVNYLSYIRMQINRNVLTKTSWLCCPFPECTGTLAKLFFCQP